MPFVTDATLNLIRHRIQLLIDAIKVPDSAFARGPIHECALEHNALAVAGNRIYLWALQPDGTLLCMDHEAFGRPTERERDPLTIYAVLLQGARRYPVLQALVPPQPPGAMQCTSCTGTGIAASETDPAESCLGCSGLGWRRA